MSEKSQPLPCFPCPAAFFGLCCLLAFPLQARDAAIRPPSKAALIEKQGDLKELRGQIGALNKEMARTQERRSGALEQLREIERSVSATQRELHTLTAEQQKLRRALNALTGEAKALEQTLGTQKDQLEKLVHRQYLLGNPDALQLLLKGDDPGQMARDFHYLGAIGRARTRLVNEVAKTLQRKQVLAGDIRERAGELAAIESRQKEQHEKLIAQRIRRKEILTNISAKLAEQRREIGNLQRDEKRLAALIDRLSRALPAKPATIQKKPLLPGQKGARPTEPLHNEKVPESAPGGLFTQHKGHLRLPARGTVTNRFGAPRQEGSTWKGLFIRAPAGSEIRAVAAGRVVFADWMRGFGNLMIVDHGSSYLSVYGNNDSLLKQVGEVLRGGEAIATVGNSGGNPESGLYFELRHQGVPFDPLRWVNLK